MLYRHHTGANRYCSATVGLKVKKSQDMTKFQGEQKGAFYKPYRKWKVGFQICGVVQKWKDKKKCLIMFDENKLIIDTATIQSQCLRFWTVHYEQENLFQISLKVFFFHI